MKKITSLVTSVILGFILTVPAYAMDKTAQTGLQFLRVGMSARSAAMGGAFVMVADDANAMFYNPAGMVGVSGFDAFGTYIGWIGDINYNAGALAVGLGNWGTVGINAIFADYGDIYGTRIALPGDNPTDLEKGFVETGLLDVSAYTVGLAYARALSTQFKVGGQVRLASQTLGENRALSGSDTVMVDNKVTGMAYDFGTIFYPGIVNSLRIGMNIKNFSPQFKYEKEPFQLPLTFVMGVAVDVFDFMGGGSNNSLTLALDAIHPRDYSERIHVGAEYWYAGMVSLRGGYKFNYSEESFSLGGGIKYSVGGIALKIDYAYSAFGVWNSVNRFSIGASF